MGATTKFQTHCCAPHPITRTDVQSSKHLFGQAWVDVSSETVVGFICAELVAQVPKIRRTHRARCAMKQVERVGFEMVFR